MKKTEPFRFKQFSIEQDQCPMKVGTDGVLLGAWAEVSNARRALDIGTGTGLIALMLAQRNPELIVHAVEIDEVACQQARSNVEQSPWPDRVTVFFDSIQDFAKTNVEPYDLIVSNPPFFSGGTFSDNHDRNSIRHTIKLPHGDLLAATRKLLSKAGRFCVILPYVEGLRFEEMAKQYHLFCTKIMEVRSLADKPVERLLMQFERISGPVEKTELIIQKEGRNNWTDEYIELTGAFYLNM